MDWVQDFVEVRTSLSGKDAAQAMARALVDSRLAACVHLSPTRSTYRWAGAVETADEYELTARTTRAAADALAALIRERHSYEVPEILAMPILGGDRTYLAWIESEVRV